MPHSDSEQSTDSTATNGVGIEVVGRDSDVNRRQRIRELRRRRMRRRGRRAYVRSVQLLPSLATLGNGICGFGAIYVATLDPGTVQADPVARALVDNRFIAAVYLVALAMIFDALDGRLARFARHTTDFGGQLDSLADAISFGTAPAIIALQVFKFNDITVPLFLSRLIWAVGGLFVACALLRLARFNVSNEHGEQNHMSFLGLPSPAAAGVVLGVVLMQQDLMLQAAGQGPGAVQNWLSATATVLTILLPFVLASAGLLMVSNFRYPHVVNRILRGRRSIPFVVMTIALVLLLVVQHRYVLGIVGLLIAYSGPAVWMWGRATRRAGRVS